MNNTSLPDPADWIEQHDSMLALVPYIPVTASTFFLFGKMIAGHGLLSVDPALPVRYYHRDKSEYNRDALSRQKKPHHRDTETTEKSPGACARGDPRSLSVDLQSFSVCSP
jgi:hypothetical protein